ncbi:MAG: bifunctional UDP-N-acetylglucosamine diphosphorylase/glucosamine-1-phosphate N-acetyltransferase GlmU [Bacillota bacterium]|nr:bifunctional UDP-N-acetylglucosamine diphosphorylase/glucosamine-1-phosphate N-acetyltransferase GlmU [Bacillota bacterium]
MDRTVAVILAAGQGKRMRSALPKVMHPLLGLPMIEYAVRAAEGAGASQVLVVVPPAGGAIQEYLGERCTYVVQPEPRGTGDALRQAEPLVPRDATLWVLYGDMPRLRPELLRAALEEHRRARATATLTSMEPADPRGYGRIVRSPEGDFLAIVEEADADEATRSLREVNAGLYVFEPEPLFEALRRVEPRNAQQEYYLVDALPRLREAGGRVAVWQAGRRDEFEGVNDRRQLAEAERWLRHRIAEGWMERGVSIVDPESTWIGPDVEIGTDARIEPMSWLLGRSRVGAGARIGPGVHLVDSQVGEGATVFFSVVEASRIGDGAQVGPFAHLRPGADLAEGALVGNFAEVKNSRVGPGTKIHHHSYIGDARLGAGVNIGAGVVTVNYDGLRKHRTEIDDGAFIGCNANLVAPLHVGEHAYVAAGSTLTQDVPPWALAIARERQSNKADWARRRQERAASEEDPR